MVVFNTRMFRFLKHLFHLTKWVSSIARGDASLVCLPVYLSAQPWHHKGFEPRVGVSDDLDDDDNVILNIK